jgi:hypothetical protein
MRLLAAGTAAALAAPASALAAPKTARSRAARPAKSAAPAGPSVARRPGARVALPAEIEKQKKGTLDSIKTLRSFPLPAGSPQAILFRPFKARPARRNG